MGWESLWRAIQTSGCERVFGIGATGHCLSALLLARGSDLRRLGQVVMAVLVVNLDGRLLGRTIKAATFRACKPTFVCQVCSSKRVLWKKCFDEEIDDWVYDPIKVKKCIILES